MSWIANMMNLRCYYCKCCKIFNNNCLPKRSSQTGQIQIRLLLKKQSDQGLPCLLFWQAFCEFQPWKPKFYLRTERAIWESILNFRTFTVWCVSSFRGHVCLIVNVASQWGFTKSNYTQLAQLHADLAESKGLRILLFPCNQFGSQVLL